jgi:hypothetical protein
MKLATLSQIGCVPSVDHDWFGENGKREKVNCTLDVQIIMVDAGIRNEVKNKDFFGQ